MPEILSRAEAKSRGLKRYSTGKPCGRGHQAERYTSSAACVACSNTASQRWSTDNAGRMQELQKNWRGNNRARLQANQNATRRANPVFWMWDRAKRRAAAKGLPFTITPEDIVIPEFCPATGISLAPGEGRMCHASPSLDRLVPELGYVSGNILVVSQLANAIKYTATPEQILSVGNFYKRLFEERAALTA